MIGALLRCLLLLAATPAWARTVAVLPFDAAAKSERYDGLGRALAGMVVSDLSRAPGLELVERDRLDALITEIDLGRGGFVDPKTAQRLGRGAGAAWVVVGSFAVVGEAFLLDGRAVDVETGRILAAADAQGGIADFVSVEKSLVEALLGGLQIALTSSQRRQILADAPTEDFQAVASYGAGLQAEFDGQLEAARAHFERATQRDPAFDLPQQRIAAVRARLEADERARRDASRDEATRTLEEALSRTSSALDRPTASDAERARHAIRFALLMQLGRHCQAADEMRRYLDRHAGRLTHDAEHPGPYNAKLVEAHALGLVGEPYLWDRGVMHVPPDGWEHLVVFDTPNVGHAGHFIASSYRLPDDRTRLNQSLLNATLACAGPDPGARVSAIAGLRKQVDRLGLRDTPTRPGGEEPLGVRLELTELWATAARDGMTASIDASLTRLLDLDLPPDAQHRVRSDAATIARVAARQARRAELLRDLTPERVLALTRGWASGDPGALRADLPTCGSFLTERAIGVAATRRERLEKVYDGGPPDPDAWRELESSARELAIADLMGCLVGRTGMIGSLAEAVAWAESADKRLRAGRDEAKCAAALAEVQKRTAERAKGGDIPPGLSTASIVRDVFTKLVEPGCAGLR